MKVQVEKELWESVVSLINNAPPGELFVTKGGLKIPSLEVAQFVVAINSVKVEEKEE